MPLHLFVDTEFTDFLACELISVAMVSSDGREFYGERSDFPRDSCSEFVRAAVLPQLGQYPDRVFTREQLRTEILSWLDRLAIEPEPRMLCFDYGGDWDLLVDLLGEVPTGWQACYAMLRTQWQHNKLNFRTNRGSSGTCPTCLPSVVLSLFRTCENRAPFSVNHSTTGFTASTEVRRISSASSCPSGGSSAPAITA